MLRLLLLVVVLIVLSGCTRVCEREIRVEESRSTGAVRVLCDDQPVPIATAPTLAPRKCVP